MTAVKNHVPTLPGRLPCSPFAPARLQTVVASQAATEQTIVGASTEIALGQDNSPPEWVQLIPPGSFSLNDGRGTFHNPLPDQVIAATQAWLGGRETCCDYDHASEYTTKTGQKAVAAGWIKDWRVRNGAVEARMEWTKTAATHITDKDYRYISPVFDADKKTNRVIRVQRFALTNSPSINDLPAIAAHQTKTTETDLDKFLPLIAQALGLAGDATETAVIAAASSMKGRLDTVVSAAVLKADATADTIIASLREKPDAAKWIAASEYQRVTGELSTVKAAQADMTKKLATDETETVLAAAIKEGKVTPGGKDYWTSVCAAAGSADPLKNFLKTAPFVVKPGKEAETADPNLITASTLSEEQKLYCAQHNIDTEKFAANLKTIVAGEHAIA
jgi:phage I-like protein